MKYIINISFAVKDTEASNLSPNFQLSGLEIVDGSLGHRNDATGPVCSLTTFKLSDLAAC
jgi:hypothetical protein